MAFDLKAMHEAMASQLQSVATAAGMNVYAFSEPSKTGPKIEVIPDGEYIAYWGSFSASGHGDVSVIVRASVAGLNAETRALAVWQLAGVGDDAASNAQPQSIVDALMADKTLGGTVATLVPSLGYWDDEASTFEVPVRVTLKKSGAQA